MIPLGILGSSRVGTVAAPSFIGGLFAYGASAALPPHQAGDLLIVIAVSWDSTIPALPAGWTSSSTSSSIVGRRIGWRVAPSAGTASGTWTNAGALYALVWRGFTAVGASASNSSYSSNSGHPALTLQAPATSWVGTLSDTDGGVAPVPSGTVSRWVDGDLRACDTNGAPGSWAGEAGTLFLGASIELRI